MKQNIIKRDVGTDEVHRNFMPVDASMRGLDLGRHEMEILHPQRFS